MAKIEDHETEQEHQLAGKYLTFLVAEEEYALPILQVQEIVGLLPITQVPGTSNFIQGVINLRGKIVPVADMRSKFNIDLDVERPESCIIVTQAEDIELGLIVDSVSDVTRIMSEDLDSVPDFGVDATADYLIGIAQCNDQVRLLIDVNRLFDSEDMEAYHSLGMDATF